MNTEQDSIVRQDVYDGLQVQFVKAPLIKRIVAYFLDVAVITVASYILIYLTFVPITLIFGSLTEESEGLAIVQVFLMIIVLLVMMFAYHYYFVWFEYHKGATLGKKAFGLKVVSLKGGKLSRQQSWIRELSRYVDCYLLFPGIICALASEKKQRLGDHIAGTLVVHSKEQEMSKTFLFLKHSEYLHAIEHVEISLPQSFVDDYFNFAYEYYIKSESNPQDFESNKVIAIDYLKSDEDFPLSDDDKMLLLAEYCNQFKIGLRNGK